jgi:hypothetical protein
MADTRRDPRTHRPQPVRLLTLALVAATVVAACGIDAQGSASGAFDRPPTQPGDTGPAGTEATTDGSATDEPDPATGTGDAGDRASVGDGDGGGPPVDLRPQGDGPGPRPAGVTGIDGCRDLATDPWTRPEHGSDPVAAVREGRVPAFVDGPDGTPLDQVTEFTTAADYVDPSILEDPVRLQDAFEEAGLVEGIEARFEEGPWLTAITVVRFRDADGAADALGAHLHDYCHRAVETWTRAEGNGLIVLRESLAVRTVFVLGDTTVSVFVCACFGTDDENRLDGLEWWTHHIVDALTAGSSTDPEPTPPVI